MLLTTGYTVRSMSEKEKVINIRELTDLRDDFVGLLAQLGQPRQTGAKLS